LMANSLPIESSLISSFMAAILAISREVHGPTTRDFLALVAVKAIKHRVFCMRIIGNSCMMRMFQ